MTEICGGENIGLDRVARQIPQVLAGLQSLRYLLRVAHPQVGGMAVAGNDVGDGGTKITPTYDGDIHAKHRSRDEPSL